MGVGIDLEDSRALERFDADALRRFLARWFTAAERSWCLAQPHLARALVVGVCCKEAAYKAMGAPDLSADQVEIQLADEGVFTAGSVRGTAAFRVRLVWITAGSGIVALAVDSEEHTGVLRQLVRLGWAEGLQQQWPTRSTRRLYGRLGG